MKNLPLKIGHRGAKGHVAENTLESIKKALELGVDAIEIDVHLSTTGELVVFHDFTLERLTTDAGEIAMKSLKELKELRINGQFEIPTLLEVLDLIDKKCMLNIELKGLRTAFETCKSIQLYTETKGWNFDGFLVSSFNHEELKTVFNINKNIPLAVLTESDLDMAKNFAQTINAKAIHPVHHLLNKKSVRQLQKLGFEVNTWTVNDIETIQRIKTYGVDGIFSDFPDRL
ncbi:glycerophosphoryl diester phosphodiesterase [Gelidibacter algens]|uniref:Glycerophosphoryl diester phosphodiesterase n=1 Tax=Gelidibacter algens TaxID=49280 RepID=A0A1A7R5M6_9FLAO|nr:glycerophosphodiester phosphodiesterase family protein [Gelidibacter algens]OBX26774.1 glycerophosphodiester phosphodiesterase [Gelidibacter algens]RAJ22779.1 glycerophosphoryl diester phosphodiesterase [Gelidibacter algens]